MGYERLALCVKAKLMSYFLIFSIFSRQNPCRNNFTTVNDFPSTMCNLKQIKIPAHVGPANSTKTRDSTIFTPKQTFLLLRKIDARKIFDRRRPRVIGGH